MENDIIEPTAASYRDSCKDAPIADLHKLSADRQRLREYRLSINLRALRQKGYSLQLDIVTSNGRVVHYTATIGNEHTYEVPHNTPEELRRLYLMSRSTIVLFYSTFYLLFDLPESRILSSFKYDERRYKHITAERLNQQELIVMTHVGHELGRLNVTTNKFDKLQVDGACYYNTKFLVFPASNLVCMVDGDGTDKDVYLLDNKGGSRSVLKKHYESAIGNGITYPGLEGPLWGSFSRYDHTGTISLDSSAHTPIEPKFGLLDVMNDSLRVFKLSNKEGTVQFVTKLQGLKEIALIGLNQTAEGGCCMLEYNINQQSIVREVRFTQAIGKFLSLKLEDAFMVLQRNLSRGRQEVHFVGLGFGKEEVLTRMTLSASEEKLHWNEEYNILVGHLEDRETRGTDMLAVHYRISKGSRIACLLHHSGLVSKYGDGIVRTVASLLI